MGECGGDSMGYCLKAGLSCEFVDKDRCLCREDVREVLSLLNGSVSVNAGILMIVTTIWMHFLA